ncbi:MAG: hypothetical protein JWQ68_528 [Cryobacterium sp.]|nr:hypothetical protein [Cryobacterium sp.]
MTWAEGEMDALVFPRARQLEWRRVPIPAEVPGHILVRIDRLGICGTDVHLFTGDIAYMKNGLSAFPFRPGHEWAGTVEAVAPDVTGLAPGDRVVGEPFLSCGHCEQCRRGRRNQCPTRNELGVRGDTPGAAAQYLRIPAENAARFADHVDPAHAVLCEPLVTVLHALSATRLESGESVGVIGTGTLGLLAVQVAHHMGARVEVLGVSERMNAAVAMGAERAVLVADAIPDRYDVVLEMSGADGSLAVATRVARGGGRIAQVGMPGSELVPIDAVAVVTKGLQISGVLGGIPFLARAVRLLEQGVVNPEALVDRQISWRHYDQALDLLMRRALDRPKVILDFTGPHADSPRSSFPTSLHPSARKGDHNRTGSMS